MTGDNPEIIATQAKEVKEVVEKCKMEIQEILDKYECRLEVAMVITSSGNSPQVIIARKS